MKTIHFVLQGKGGVGKSLIANVLMQYALENNIPTIAVDTDPVNKSFASVPAFNATEIELLNEETHKLNHEKFDELINLIFANQESDFIIDNGASSFIDLSAYLMENGVIDFLKENGFRVVIHTVITGGEAMTHTLSGFKSLTDLNTGIAVWLNGYHGKVELEGKSFTELKVYKENSKNVLAILSIQKYSELFEKDLKWCLNHNKTFNEAINLPEVGIMNKQRIMKVKKEIFFQIDGLYRELVD